MVGLHNGHYYNTPEFDEKKWVFSWQEGFENLPRVQWAFILTFISILFRCLAPPRTKTEDDDVLQTMATAARTGLVITALTEAFLVSQNLVLVPGLCGATLMWLAITLGKTSILHGWKKTYRTLHNPHMPVIMWYGCAVLFVLGSLVVSKVARNSTHADVELGGTVRNMLTVTLHPPRLLAHIYVIIMTIMAPLLEITATVAIALTKIPDLLCTVFSLDFMQDSAFLAVARIIWIFASFRLVFFFYNALSDMYNVTCDLISSKISPFAKIY